MYIICKNTSIKSLFLSHVIYAIIKNAHINNHGQKNIFVEFYKFERFLLNQGYFIQILYMANLQNFNMIYGIK
jgi:hypothetical protein